MGSVCRNQALRLELSNSSLMALGVHNKYCIFLTVTSFLNETSEATYFQLIKKVGEMACQIFQQNMVTVRGFLAKM